MNLKITPFLLTLVLIPTLDMIWLSAMIPLFYKKHLAEFLTDSPSRLPVLIFYLLYGFGVYWLVVQRVLNEQQNVWVALLWGALFGLCAYGAYDLTNQATLKNWPLVVTVVDMAWGAIVTGVASAGAVFLTQKLNG